MTGSRTKAVVYGVASTVSVSRVLARQHFPSDVVVGSTFGYLIGGYVLQSPVAGAWQPGGCVGGADADGAGIELRVNLSARGVRQGTGCRVQGARYKTAVGGSVFRSRWRRDLNTSAKSGQSHSTRTSPSSVLAQPVMGTSLVELG